MLGTAAAAFAAIGATAPGDEGPRANAARLTEIGKIDDVQASCPDDPCLALTYTTGLQAQIGDQKNVMTARRAGRLVAFTVKLGKPKKEQVAFYQKNFGKVSKARITVLKPEESLKFRVSGQSEEFALDEYFGRTVQFPLKRTLTVKKGYVIALSVPTWAPVLAANLEKTNAWRASRPKGSCDPPYRQTAQTKRGQVGEYRCLYRTARLTYTATVISTP